MNNKYLSFHRPKVSRQQRNQQNNHKSLVIWFTGLSGSGKSTIAHAVEEELFKLALKTIVLDGDNIRYGLCSDLGFSDKDRKENMRRIGELSKLFFENGFIVIAAFISPFRNERNKIKNLFSNSDFVEIYVDCPIEVCEERDVKGFYKKARQGSIKNYTGITSPYETPVNPDFIINTSIQTLEESVDFVTSLVLNRVSIYD